MIGPIGEKVLLAPVARLLPPSGELSATLKHVFHPFASSVFVPDSSMPSWLQAFAKVSPVTLTANAARSLSLVPFRTDAQGAKQEVSGTAPGSW